MAKCLIRYGASPLTEDSVFTSQENVRPLDLSRTEEMTLVLRPPTSLQSTPSTNLINPSPDPRDDISAGTTSPLSSSYVSSPELVEFQKIEEKIRRLEDMNQQIRDSLSCQSPSNKPVRPSTPETLMKDDGRFLSWLAGLRLESLYPCLADAGFDDLSQLFNQMRSASPLTEAVLEEVGVLKLGHKLVLLAGLERDSMQMNNQLRQESRERRRGMCCEVHTTAPMMMSFPTLKAWLEGLGLGQYLVCFEEAGFCEVEQMLFVMYSRRPLNESSLREIGVDKVGHRHRLLCKLQEDALNFEPRLWPFRPSPLQAPASPKGCAAM